MADVVREIFGFHKEALGFQIAHNRFPALEYAESAVLFGCLIGNFAFVANNGNLRECVSFGRIVVVLVMCRS